MRRSTGNMMWAAFGLGAGYLASKYGNDMMKKMKKANNRVKQNVKNSSAS